LQSQKYSVFPNLQETFSNTSKGKNDGTHGFGQTEEKQEILDNELMKSHIKDFKWKKKEKFKVRTYTSLYY